MLWPVRPAPITTVYSPFDNRIFYRDFVLAECILCAAGQSQAALTQHILVDRLDLRRHPAIVVACLGLLADRLAVVAVVVI